jgi:hypothetical protein
MPIAAVVRAFLEKRDLYLYVADASGKLLGIVDLHDVKDSLRDDSAAGLVIAQDLVQDIPTLAPDESLVSVNEKLWFPDYGQLPVVDPTTGQMVGLVTRREILGAVDREVLQRSAHLARVERAPADPAELKYFELPEHHRLAGVAVPESLIDKALGESRLREDFGLNVLAILRSDEHGVEHRFVPHREDKLGRGDRLVVLASDDALARLPRA